MRQAANIPKEAPSGRVLQIIKDLLPYDWRDANLFAEGIGLCFKGDYREAIDGQILEEGINEAGAMSSFIAAGTAYANLGYSMIPFYIYYSMFGFQRVGDPIWAAADSPCKGLLLGGTS